MKYMKCDTFFPYERISVWIIRVSGEKKQEKNNILANILVTDSMQLEEISSA